MASNTPGTGSDRDQQVRQEIDRGKEDAERMVSEAAGTVRERGHESLEQAKERTADQADELASALDATADDLESDGGNEALSGYGHSMAAMVRRFAGGLRENEIEEFAGEIAGYARRNPASFLAGSVALGFGLSRIVKSSSSRGDEESFGAEDFGLDEDESYDLEARQEEDYDETMRRSRSSRWPEDRGGERPGGGSPTEHLSPAASTGDSASTETDGREDAYARPTPGGSSTEDETGRRSEP